MKPKLLVSLFFLAFSYFLCSSQNSEKDKYIDSLTLVLKNQKDTKEKVNTIAALYNAYLYQDAKVAKEYAEDELALSKEIDYEKGIATSLYHLGVYYNNLDEIDSAKAYYNKSLKIYKELNDQPAIANVNHGFAILEYSKGNFEEALKILDENIEIYTKSPVDSSSLAVTHVLKGGIYRQQGNFKIALNEALASLNIYENLNEDIRKADATGLLAAVEFNLENFSNSIEYNKKALKIYQDNNDQFYSAQALNDIGNSYYYLEDYDQALKYLHKSNKLSKKVNSKDLIATSLGNIGKVYTKLNKHEEAIVNLNKSLEITRKSGNQYKTIESLNDLGIVYNTINKPQTAIPKFNEAITLAEKINANQNLKISHFNLSKSYSKLNNNKLALEEYKKFTDVSDSIFNETKIKQIEELRTIYQTEKKEQEITFQKNEIELLQEKQKASTLQKSLLVLGIISLLVMFSLMYYALRQKMKKNKLVRENLNKDLEFKSKELTTHALHLAQKNEVLESLKQKVKDLKANNSGQGCQQIIQEINFNLQDDNNWENFSRYFEQVHSGFNTSVKKKFPSITTNELRLMALLRMNMSSKEIASILNISNEGVKKARYRLRKKLALESDDSLQDTVLQL